MNQVLDKNTRIPESYTEYCGECIMSNFDGLIVEETANFIKGRDLLSGYSAWNFYGKVWFQEDSWLCEVWCNGSWKESFVCETLEGLMEEVSGKYGYE